VASGARFFQPVVSAGFATPAATPRPAMANERQDLTDKPDWQLRRDTHAKGYPENLRNWLRLDIVWSTRAENALAAVEAVLAGQAPPAGLFQAVERLEEADLVDEWVVDVPVVKRALDPALEWLLLWREADRLTVMSLYDDMTFERVFWDPALGGPSSRWAVAAAKAPAATTKSLPRPKA